jgi:hypothetical protein
MSLGRAVRPSFYMTADLGMLVYDADGLAPDLATVNALSRLRLHAKRGGLELRLRHVSPQLRAVIALAGLAEVLLAEDERGTEQREQRLGVQEERHLGDGAV